MNIPNFLTVLRIFLTFFFFEALFAPGIGAKLNAAFIFLLASLTDLFDGYYARKYHLITDFGKIMDPIADKFLILTAIFGFARLEIIAWWMFMLIAGREILITILRLLAMRRGKVLAAEMAGKVKTILQMITILLILFFIVGRETFIHGNTQQEMIWLNSITLLMWVVVGLTVYSGISFLWFNRHINYVR